MTPKVNMTAEETETTINYPVDKRAELYTTDKTIMKRYEKFALAHPDCCKLISEDKYSMTFSVAPKCASLYPRAPRKVNYTEKQREELRQRLAKVRDKRE